MTMVRILETLASVNINTIKGIFLAERARKQFRKLFLRSTQSGTAFRKLFEKKNSAKYKQGQRTNGGLWHHKQSKVA
jgi:hypothetical protein